MSEEIKKNEITEEELEGVSGGAAVTRCRVCGGRVAFAFNEETKQMDKVICMDCGRRMM